VLYSETDCHQVALERLVPLQYGLTNVTQDSFNMTYVGILIGVVNYITETKGAYAIVDPHNYMRYKYARPPFTAIRC
jgi:endoglucanase